MGSSHCPRSRKVCAWCSGHPWIMAPRGGVICFGEWSFFFKSCGPSPPTPPPLLVHLGDCVVSPGFGVQLGWQLFRASGKVTLSAEELSFMGIQEQSVLRLSYDSFPEAVLSVVVLTLGHHWSDHMAILCHQHGTSASLFCLTVFLAGFFLRIALLTAILVVSLCGTTSAGFHCLFSTSMSLILKIHVLFYWANG